MSAAVRAEPALPLPALAASLALHAAVVVMALLSAQQPRPKLLATGPDVWLGSSVEIESPSAEELAGSQRAATRGAEPPAPESPPVAPPPVAPPSPPLPEPDGAPLVTVDERDAAPPPRAIASQPSATLAPATPPRPRPRKPAPAASANAANDSAANDPATSGVASSAAAAAAPNSPGTAASVPGSSPGSFGTTGLPPGVRRLAYAFTRAVPMAGKGDPIWRTLPAGVVGTLRIEIEVDAEGRVAGARRWKSRAGEPEAPASVQSLIDRTLLFLKSGQFALSGAMGAGVERMIVEVSLSDGPASTEASETVVEIGQREPLPGRPGAGYFRYGTGRRFDAKVTIVPAARD